MVFPSRVISITPIALLEQVLPVLRANGGRAFLLFTSHRSLNLAAEWLRSRTDFHLLVQEEAPRQVLLKRFRETPRSVFTGARPVSGKASMCQATT